MTETWEDFYEQLYDDADRAPGQNGAAPEQDDLNPLYKTLRAIDRRYENEMLIGKGGWKTIYRVYDVRAGREVALARPRTGLPMENYDAFLREAHITAKMEHANIIKVFDMGVEADGTPFFTMEFKRGQSLNEKLRAAQDDPAGFTLEERLNVFLAVCDAIAYAHYRRVLHLDLKPENIQVGDFGEVQVCDWGLGEIAIDRSGKLSEGDALLDPDLYGDNGDPRMIKGTPGFMAPEQANPGEPHTYQTDIYALGKTLELLVAAKPQRALSAMIEKATARSPQARYASVEALRDDVRRFLLLKPTSVEPGGVAREAWLFMRRHQRICVIAAVALLVIMILSSLFLAEIEVSRRGQLAALAQADEAQAQADEAQAQAEKSQAEADQATDEVVRTKSQLAMTEQEKMLAQADAARAGDWARAMIDRRHENAYEQSLLLINVLVTDPFYSRQAVEETIEVLEEALSLGTLDRSRVRRQLGYTYFLSQRFDKAETYYQGLAEDLDLKALIPKYNERLNSRSFLPTEDLIELIGDLSGGKQGLTRLPLIEKMIVYDSAAYRDAWMHKADIVMAALVAANPGWSTALAKRHHAHRGLTLSGKSLRWLANTVTKDRRRKMSLMQTLRLKSLTLIDTKFLNLDDLTGMALQELTLINTTPRGWELLRHMRSLKRVRVNDEKWYRKAVHALEKHGIQVELIE